MDSTKDKKKSLKDAPSDVKAAMIAEFADDMKAQEIETLDLRKKTTLADYFVVCTATSDTHARAVAERVAEKLRDHGIKPYRQSVGEDKGWILFDYGDVVLHVMQEEKRQFYDLESFWTSMQVDPDLAKE